MRRKGSDQAVDPSNARRHRIAVTTYGERNVMNDTVDDLDIIPGWVWFQCWIPSGRF